MRRERLVLLLLIVLTIGVFARVSVCDFVNYDDNDYVTDNSVVKQGLTREGIAWAFGRWHGDKTYWHPVTWLSHMLDCQLFGLRPMAHHLVNLLFHTLNVALLFLLLTRMTGALWCSAAVAAFWAIHPLQVDSVAWVTERKNLLSVLFGLLTIAAYIRYVGKPGPLRYAVVLVGLAVGLMCKPTLVVTPFLLLLLDYWPLQRTPIATPGLGTSPHVSFGMLIAEKLPLLALALASMWITVRSHAGLNITQATSGLPLSLRLENAVVSYARYLKKVLWPGDLAVFYPHPGSWPSGFVWGCLLVLLALTAVILWRTRHAPYLFVGWFWFLGVLVPAIGVLQIGSQAMADRFVYLPLIGLLILIVWSVADWTGADPRRLLVARLTAVVALLACAATTWRQIGFWKDSESLYRRAVAVTRDNYIMESNLAYTLREAGRLDEAREHALTAVRISPRHLPAHMLLALICEGLNRPEEAVVHYQNVLALQPNWLDALKRYAGTLLQLGRLEQALERLARVVQLTPADHEAHSQLALVLSTQKKPADAIRHYREALRLKPDWPEALNNLAWLLATQSDASLRDGAEAVRLAERACAASNRKQAVYLGTLAAAYAEAGRFGDATKTAQEAIDIASANNDTQLAETNAKLLQLYRAGKSYREESK